MKDQCKLNLAVWGGAKCQAEWTSSWSQVVLVGSRRVLLLHHFSRSACYGQLLSLPHLICNLSRICFSQFLSPLGTFRSPLFTFVKIIQSVLLMAELKCDLQSIFPSTAIYTACSSSARSYLSTCAPYAPNGTIQQENSPYKVLFCLVLVKSNSSPFPCTISADIDSLWTPLWTVLTLGPTSSGFCQCHSVEKSQKSTHT